MHEGEEPDDALPSGIDGAFAAAREMGVKVDLSGNLPQSKTERDILSHAILECAANTAKHSGGDRLSVDLTDDGTGLTIVLCGNGTPPTEPVIEAGGLSMLRRTVDKVSGTMDVRCDPNVTVALRIPKK
jgi:signal transduction histidine kinase